MRIIGPIIDTRYHTVESAASMIEPDQRGLGFPLLA